MKPMEQGSGFFYRQNDSQYLISVYHLLSGCPLNSTKRPKFRPDTLEIRIQTDTHHFIYRRVSLEAHKARPCMTNRMVADADTLNVTAWFRDIQVNSIEELTCKSCCEQDSLSTGDTLVSYGFSHVKDPVHFRIETPTDNEGNLVLAKWYYFIAPILDTGDSGSPVFRIHGKKGKAVEFVGLQSSTAQHKKYSIITKRRYIPGQFF